MKTVAGETVTFNGLPLVSVTTTPPSGAGLPRVTGNGTGAPNGTFKFAGSPIVERVTTVIVAVVSGRLGGALAWITADPAATLVTGTLRVLAPDGNVTLGGTVATAGLLDLNVTVNPPAGAGTGMFSSRFCVVPT
ncbi:MAG: hypothetical protein M3Z85_00475, partial [Acidobacteriota bacterium]|nr:hypothetical protein [Acidobacteriota bacterium]